MRALAYICKDLPTKLKVAKGAQCCKVLRERAGDLEASARGADRELRQDDGKSEHEASRGSRQRVFGAIHLGSEKSMEPGPQKLGAWAGCRKWAC